MRKRFTMVEKIASSDQARMHRINSSKFKAKRKKFGEGVNYVLKLAI